MIKFLQVHTIFVLISTSIILVFHEYYHKADYYETGTWLTEEEKKEMDDNERKRRDAKKPSNRKFKMSFDIAGRYKK